MLWCRLQSAKDDIYEHSSPSPFNSIMSHPCTLEDVELVTCSLCQSEFSRKEFECSAITFENHQPDGRSSTFCAFCPACSSQIREHYPPGPKKDMVELRKAYKRTQDYTEELREAYDDLRKKVEEKAAKKDIQKKMDIFRELLQRQKEVAKATLELLKKVEESKAGNKDL